MCNYLSRIVSIRAQPETTSHPRYFQRKRDGEGGLPEMVKSQEVKRKVGGLRSGRAGRNGGKKRGHEQNLEPRATCASLEPQEAVREWICADRL